MPGVGKKKFSYTKKGKAAAKRYAKKKGLKVRKIKKPRKKNFFDTIQMVIKKRNYTSYKYI